MFHWYVVGHIDPLDPVDTSGIPNRPKVLRSLSREAAEQVESEFGTDIDDYVSFEEPGFVVCNWSFAPAQFPVAFRNCFCSGRETGAVVMDERHMVLWPQECASG